MKKRILSCLMALALCLTLLPTAALAEEPEGTAQTLSLIHISFKMADYDCQMYYPITEVQEITAYNFVPADQVQDAVIKDGVRDMVDPDHIISTED